LPFSF